MPKPCGKADSSYNVFTECTYDPINIITDTETRYSSKHRIYQKTLKSLCTELRTILPRKKSSVLRKEEEIARQGASQARTFAT